MDYLPKVEHATNAAFHARQRNESDSWYLVQVGIDPKCAGKGYGSMLMRHGFQRASSMPIHLEATSTTTRDIYLHYGFVVETECCFGVGEVNSKGIKAKKKEAGGHNEWIMLSGEHEFGAWVYLQASLFSLARKYLYLFHTNP